MFKLALTATYSHPVKLAFPGGGAASFEAIFNRLTQAELDEIARRIASPDEPMTDAEVVERVLAGWKGVADADGVDLAFTPSNVADVLAVAGVRAALVEAFFESHAEARRKNSRAPRGTGPAGA